MFFWIIKQSVPVCGCRGPQHRNIHQTGVNFVVPKNLKGKSVSSQAWITRQLNDPFVSRAKKAGFRARSAYKLLELDKRFDILRPGQIVVDCGASPGAWTQVAVKKVNSTGDQEKKDQGKVISIDLLPIQPIMGALTLPRCDFTDPETIKKILRLARGESLEDEEEIPSEDRDDNIIDVVLSDMAPNATGFRDADHYRILTLARHAFDFAVKYGKPNSSYLCKIWEGSDTNNLVDELKQHYRIVKTSKPEASRDKSSETYICAKKKFS